MVRIIVFEGTELKKSMCVPFIKRGLQMECSFWHIALDLKPELSCVVQKNVTAGDENST